MSPGNGDLSFYLLRDLTLLRFPEFVYGCHNLAESYMFSKSIAPPIHSGVSHNATALQTISYNKVKEEQKSCLGKSGLENLEVPFHTVEMLSQYLHQAGARKVNGDIMLSFLLSISTIY